MKKPSLLVVSWIIILSHLAAQQNFSVLHLKDSLTKHRFLAMLPARVTLSFKELPKHFDLDANKAEERKTGLDVQQTMYGYFRENADQYAVSFQDVDTTYALLTKAGIADNFDELSSDSIAKVLGVDAIVKASYNFERKRSEAGAIANSVLFGFGGSKGTGSLTMQLYSGASGTLLWSFYKQLNERAIPNSDEGLIEKLIRKISKDFPYRK